MRKKIPQTAEGVHRHNENFIARIDWHVASEYCIFGKLLPEIAR